MIRTLWAWFNALIATVPIASMIIAGGLFNASGDFYTWGSSTWAKWILWTSGVRVHLEGLDHLALDEPQVIVSNHASWYDVFGLAAWLPKRYRFIAKVELSRIPLFGPAWMTAGHIAIDRHDRVAALAAMDRAGQAIRTDHSAIVIFPEGTRSDDGLLLPFKKGGFMVALRTGVDIVPCAVVGSRDIQEKGNWRVRSGEITIRFGPPIATAGRSEDERDHLVQDVRDQIARMLEEPAHSTK